MNALGHLCVSCLLIVASLVSSAQGTWTFNYEAQGANTVARDAIELDDGRYIVALSTNVFRSDLAKRSYLVLLDESGGLELMKGLRYPGLSLALAALVPSDTSVRIHAVGFASDTISDNGYGFLHYQLDQSMVMLDSARFVFDAITRLSLENAALDQDGDLFLASAAEVNGPVYDRILLMKFSQTGDSISSALLGVANGLAHAYHAIPYNGNMLVTVEGSDVGPPGYGKILSFNDQLQYVGGFATLSLSGTGSTTPLDSVMRKNMSFFGMTSGELIVSGVYGNWWPDGYRVVLSKFTSTGEPVEHFFPRSDLYADFAAHLSGIEKIDEGSFLFGMIEGFSSAPNAPLQSPAPSRVHIFRMDTSLNVLCDYVVDGFADSTYYYLQRVKYTSDGGTLLMGSRQDLSIPNSVPIAWVQKLGPNDCNVGIADHARPTAQVFPNPGSSGFTVLLNGNLVNNGRLVLSDAQGRLVARSPVQSNRAQVNAESLAAGIYFYRVLDAKEQRVASGKWVKE